MGEVEEIGTITDQDLLDRTIEESGHIAPPEHHVTVDSYLAKVEAKGGAVSRNTALQALLRQVKAGKMEGCKMNLRGRQRWVFWSTNHREVEEGQ